MSDQGLLPCPFCGEAAKWVRPMGEWTANGYGPDRWRVSCSTANCWAMTPATDTEAEAITAWNTRTPPTTGDKTDA